MKVWIATAITCISLVSIAFLVCYCVGSVPSGNGIEGNNSTDNPIIIGERDTNVYATSISCCKAISLTLDEEDCELEYEILPASKTVVEEISTTGDCFSLVNNYILPNSVGTGKITIVVASSSAHNLVKEITVNVVPVPVIEFEQVLSNHTYKYGKKANNEEEIYSVVVTSNYPLSEEILTIEYENVELIDIDYSQDNSAEIFFSIKNSVSSISFSAYEKSVTLNLEAEKYIDSCSFSFMENLVIENGQYKLFLIDQNYAEDAEQNNIFSKCEITYPTTFEISSDSDLIIIDDNIIEAKQVGMAEIILTATDGSGYEKTIQFIISNTTATGIANEYDDITMRIDSSETVALPSVVPQYAKVKNWVFEYDNTYMNIVNGTIHALKVGTAVVKLVVNDVECKSFSVTINDYPVVMKIQAQEISLDDLEITQNNLSTDINVEQVYFDLSFFKNSVLCENQSCEIVYESESHIININMDAFNTVVVEILQVGIAEIKIKYSNGQEFIINFTVYAE